MTDMLRRMESFSSDTELQAPCNEGFILRFSNTGRRDGVKWFAISQSQLVSALQDLLDNLTEFQRLAGHRWSEAPWRNAFRQFLSDDAVHYLSKVQTLPLFQLLAKTIAAAPSGGAYRDGIINLDADGIQSAIEALKMLDGTEADAGAPDDDTARLTGGDNVLFYGAPGTGKSHAVDLRVGRDRAFRTVFHPDMQNSDFVGTLKPGLDDSGNVTYAFRPGPFASAVAYAWAHPDKKVYLVIEELNRAMAAAVFGELFQLLDRKADGTGRYKVDFPSPEFAKWFEAETGSGRTSLRLPSNLWILATMNSADQGVYPLDTAFRRRWTQEYLPIDYSTAPAATLTYSAGGTSRQTDWATFVEALNGFLVDSLQIGEDRLVGPRFASESDLASGQLPSKLLIYLWDDLLRHHGRDLLFATGIDTYGKLHKRVEAGKPAFSTGFLQRLGESDDGENADNAEHVFDRNED